MKDIDAIRRENLRRLEREAGSSAEIARRIGMSQTQFTNLRDGAKDSKTGKPRGMRKETARRIEINAGKAPGWLDTDHDTPPPVPQAPTTDPVPLTRNDRWPFEVAQERLQVLHDGDWIHLNSTIKAIVEVRERDNLARKSANSRS